MGLVAQQKPHKTLLSSSQKGTTNIPKIYHLKGASNYGVWAHRVKHMLSNDGLFTYCVMSPSAPMTTMEATTRFKILNYFHNNAKNHI
jgi:hypothetical protein